MAMLRKMLGVGERTDLKEARAENVQAREALLSTIHAQQERGHTVSLSLAALERIKRVEPSNH